MYTRNQDTRTRAPGCIYTREYIQVYEGARIQEPELQVASSLENISRYTRSQDTIIRSSGCIYTREYIQVYKKLGYKNQSFRLHLHQRIYPGIQGARIQELEIQVASTLENISRQTWSQDTRTRDPGCIYTREYIQVYKELGYKNLELQVASTLENISRYTRSQDTRTRDPGCIYKQVYSLGRPLKLGMNIYKRQEKNLINFRILQIPWIPQLSQQ